MPVKESEDAASQGLQLYLIGEIDAAIQSYTDAIALDDTFAAHHLNRGNLYLYKGQLQEALDDFNKAIDLDPRFAESYVSRARLLTQVGQSENALEDLDTAINLSPDHAIAHSRRGDAYATVQRNEEALEAYGKALEFEPNLTEALHNRSWLHLRLQNFDAAIADLDAALKTDVARDVSHFNKGYALSCCGKFSQALEEYSQCLQYNKDFANAYLMRGGCQQQLGNWDEARKDMDTAVKLVPNNLAARASYAFTLLTMELEAEAKEQLAALQASEDPGMKAVCAQMQQQLGGTDNSRRILRELSENHPNNPVVQLNMGTFYSRRGDLESALPYFDRSISLLVSTESLTKRALLHCRMKNYEKAIADSEQALNLDPLFAAAFSVQALAYFELGEFEKCMEACNLALNSGKSDRSALTVRGMLQTKLKNYDQALADLNLAVKYKVDTGAALLQRGLLHKEKGEFEKAREDLTEALRILERRDQLFYAKQAATALEELS